MLLGVDQVLDGVHFDSSKHSPFQIGQKVMNRNLSDCAAMACLPVAALVCWALPRGTDSDYVKQLYTGMKQAAEVFGCQIVGGGHRGLGSETGGERSNFGFEAEG
ncbi:MAG: hypothetical protein KatS3mg104_1218 [Phycisphaerae bacterium]|nr:MAG: hypothetical protein KatS3mg104_1218 [Phycisphaerae bacterium]